MSSAAPSLQGSAATAPGITSAWNRPSTLATLRIVIDERSSLRAARIIAIVLALGACAPKPVGNRQVTGSSTPNAPTRAADAGTRDAPGSESCVRLVVGSGRENALLCDEIHDQDYWRVTHQVVRVVRAGRSVLVLDVPTKIEGQDSGDLWLELRLTVGSSGLAASLDSVPLTLDGPPASQPGPLEDCDTAPDWNDSEVKRQAGLSTYRELRRRFCNARGPYKWNGGRFQPPPPRK